MLSGTRSKAGVALFFLAFACPVWIMLTLVYRLVYFVVDGYNPTFQLATLCNHIFTKVIPTYDFGARQSIWLVYEYIPSLQWDFFQSIFNVFQITMSFIYYLPLELGLVVWSFVFLLLGCLVSYRVKSDQEI
jgi:hypothetical protein